jgi:hypothetical protein
MHCALRAFLALALLVSFGACSSGSAPSPSGGGGSAAVGDAGAAGGSGLELPPSTPCPPACGSGQYCNFGDRVCGAAQGSGRCAVVASGCVADSSPVCGCDGQVYDSICQANAAGFDVSTRPSDCEAPPNHVACNGLYCSTGQEACVHFVAPVDEWSCEPLPDACKSTSAYCTCFGASSGCSCALEAGAFTLVCATE